MIASASGVLARGGAGTFDGEAAGLTVPAALGGGTAAAGVAVPGVEMAGEDGGTVVSTIVSTAVSVATVSAAIELSEATTVESELLSLSRSNKNATIPAAISARTIPRTTRVLRSRRTALAREHGTAARHQECRIVDVRGQRIARDPRQLGGGRHARSDRGDLGDGFAKERGVVTHDGEMSAHEAMSPTSMAWPRSR